jgi:RimJ/RimL family protein N-acetyltransferase
MQRDQVAPRTIRLETPHYIVRTIEQSDGTDNLRGWMTDPVTVRGLNARPTAWTDKELREYVAKFDRVTSHLLGIFEKETGLLVGVRALYVNHQRKEFLVNVLIGESQARGKGARTESSEAMYRFFFTEMGMHAALCTVLSTNDAILRVMDRNGWVQVRSDLKPAANGQGFVEIREFRLSREAWKRHEGERGAQTA